MAHVPLFEPRRQLFVRQHAALLKLSGAYDILDPATKQIIGNAKETPATWAKLLRLVVNKGFLPTAVEIREGNAPQPSLSLHKSPGLFTHRVSVRDGTGNELAYFKTKAWSFRSRLRLFTPDGREQGELVGDWKGWDFTLRDAQEREIGKVTKKWAGLGKELFTTADSYMISLADHEPASSEWRAILFAAGFAVDLALKEHSG